MILDRHSFGIWSFIAKHAFKAVFTKIGQLSVSRAIIDTLRERETALYIHIPFCRSICFYCPYVRFPIGRDSKLISKYVNALCSEIKAYGNLLKELDLKIADIHAGGGTPSLLSGRYFKMILESLAENFGAEPRIAIEANPEDLRDEAHVFDLVDNGVTEVSLGVQSFNERMLKSLGRRHTPEDSLMAIENLHEAGVEYTNIDMMYMIPTRSHDSPQSIDEWRADLEKAIELDVDEITCYPTLITDYCIGYRWVKSGEVVQPDKRTFKKMVYLTEDILSSAGFEPVEIYGYSKKSGWKYVTVNYEMEGPLLGLGCGAMGFTGGFEYQNTCSVPDYIQSVREGKFPIAGARFVDLRERAIRYTTCRLFVCRHLSFVELKRKLGEGIDKFIKKSGFGRFLQLLRLTGRIKYRTEGIQLTRKGLFTAHQICWAFVLNVPCRISEKFLKDPWPEKVHIP
ncbi:MAG: hypothetical protein DRJ49_07475 [Thermoprotei archaeon]|nr:MAG: hypothetical protein DRJ49_07475 [Thermoprotei archaeon]